MVAIFTGLGSGLERGSGTVLGSAGLFGSSGFGRGGEDLFLNAANGNVVINQQDEFVSGMGLDAAVTRTYNSLGNTSDDNGDNWRQGYDRRIINAPATYGATNSTVQRVSGDGSIITYTWSATTNAYVATDGGGAYDTLTKTGSVWTWTDGDSQVKETYTDPTSSGTFKLATRVDVDGNTVGFAYGANNLISTVTTSGSDNGVSTITYAWSGNNLMSITTAYKDLSTSQSKTLTRTSYTYSGNRLATVTVDLTPDVTTDSNSYTRAANG